MESVIEINKRIKNIPPSKILAASTLLRHFSIITYLVDVQKLRALIPQNFDIYTIINGEKSFGLVSAVTFIDKDFHFKKYFHFSKYNFLKPTIGHIL